MDTLEQRIEEAWILVRQSVGDPGFYGQLGLVATAVLAAFILAALLSRRFPLVEPRPGPLLQLRQTLVRLRHLVMPALAVLLLGAAIEGAAAAVGQTWVVRLALSVAVFVLLHRLITQFVASPFLAAFFTWVAIPLATLRVFGWLDNVSLYLDTISLEVGTIRISALALGRTIVFGCVLIWVGTLLSTFGKQLIRSRQALDSGTREVITKLFEISLFVVIFLLLLGAMGINLTALAVFGGALGVGIGFGLQQIASNLISGIIILLDRSITPGDYIEFDDGRAGMLRELTMRSATLETFDGKDIMVPNEQFITTSFINWTHKNKKQRYSVEFSVSYDTDLHEMLRLVKEAVAAHPQVLSGSNLPIEEQPDAEISSFGDSGVNILVEFWMEGIDDGPNRVGADLRMIIWDVLKEHSIEIPFPQRDIRIRQPSQ